jgi:hypothetical protein
VRLPVVALALDDAAMHLLEVVVAVEDDLLRQRRPRVLHRLPQVVAGDDLLRVHEPLHPREHSEALRDAAMAQLHRRQRTRQSKIRVDLVVRVTLVQRLGLSATDIVMQASRVRTVGVDTARHSGPLAPLLRRLLQYSIKKVNLG